MKKDFPFVKVPVRLLTFVGEPDPGTRQYRLYGTEAGYRMWFDVVSRICKPDGFLSPSGAAIYIGVSRAGVHKRLKEGRLTVFLFHKMKWSRLLKESELIKKKVFFGNAPFSSNAFIPVSECKAWAAELEGKTMEEFEQISICAYDLVEESLISPSPRKWQRKVKKD